MKKILLIIMMLYFITFCYSQKLNSLKLEIVQYHILFIFESHHRDRERINSQALESILGTLYEIFIQENNYIFVFQLEGLVNTIRIFDGTNLLASMNGVFLLYPQKTSFFADGMIFDNKFNNFFEIESIRNRIGLYEANIKFRYGYRNSDKYFFIKIYYTYGDIMYIINRYQWLPPDFPLLERRVIYR